MSKKVRLLSRKEKILNEIKYYDKRIQDARRDKKYNIYEEDSSDSEIEFTINNNPSVSELKLQAGQVQTCLQATQELTSLHILQSEVNVLIDPPTFECEPSITEDGLWREVMVDCRIDLVSFSMTFYTLQPERPFGQPLYRGLRVIPVKPVHEKELTGSVLPRLTVPSDAVEVLRSYAHAHRSRRSTLARLAERYGGALFMESSPEGGYVLRCADLLEISWSLQNKWSPVAPFHHKMSFDLEYMEESYVRVVSQAHRQLGDPAVHTDERTLLLAKIIETCLEAHERAAPPGSADSQIPPSSDHEYVNVNRDSEIMAPPKSLPKKVKPKGKENTEASTGDGRKRANGSNGESERDRTKRAKTVPDKVASSENSRNSTKSNLAGEGASSRNDDAAPSAGRQRPGKAKEKTGASKSTKALQSKTNAQPIDSSKQNEDKNNTESKSKGSKMISIDEVGHSEADAEETAPEDTNRKPPKTSKNINSQNINPNTAAEDTAARAKAPAAQNKNAKNNQNPRNQSAADDPGKLNQRSAPRSAAHTDNRDLNRNGKNQYQATKRNSGHPVRVRGAATLSERFPPKKKVHTSDNSANNAASARQLNKNNPKSGPNIKRGAQPSAGLPDNRGGGAERSRVVQSKIPRIPQSKSCATQDSTKTSTGSLRKRTNIPRLLKNPAARPVA